MMKESRKCIIFAWISFITILACAILPIFSFYNYRLFMFPYLLVSFLALRCISKDYDFKRERVMGIVIILVAVITLFLNSWYKTYIYCSAICFVMAIVMMKEDISGVSIALGGLTFLITSLAQLLTIIDFYSSYQTAISGTVYLPWEGIPDQLLWALHNEIGMLIVIVALNVSLLAYISDKKQR